MANNNNITLKIDADVSDAQSAIDKFTKSTQTAFNSSNSKIQSLGNSLNKVNQNLQRNVDELNRMNTTRVPTEQYTQLENRLRETQQQASLARKELEQIGKTRVYTAQYVAATDSVNKAVAEFEKAKLKVGQLQNAGAANANNPIWIQAEADLKKYQLELENAVKQQVALEVANKKFAPNTAYDTQQQKVQNLDNTVVQLQQDLATMHQNGTATQLLSEADPDRAHRLEQNITNAMNSGSLLAGKIQQMTAGLFTSENLTHSLSTGFSRVKNVVTSLASTINHRLTSAMSSYASKHNTSFKSMLTMALKYVFGIRSIFLLYKKLRTTISTGMTSLGKDFSEVQDQINSLKNSWSTFKSSLVSAFQPIYSYVLPALTSLINYLSTAMNALANFIALLTGQSYYYKATKQTKDYGDAVSGTGDSAKEASEELAEYDDLIVISQDSSSGGGSGSGSGSSDEWKWEEVKTTSTALSEDLSKIFKAFQESWNKYGKAVTDAFKGALSSIKSLLGTIWDTVVKVFTDGTGSAWVDSILLTFTDILNTVKDIATAIENAWKKNDTGEKLVKSILEMFTSINTTIGKITKSLQTAWNKNNTGETIISKILTTFTNINNTIKNLADNLGKAWDKNNVGDKILSTILGTVKSIVTFIEKITSATESWSKKLDFYPLLQSIETVLTSVSGIIDSILSVATSLYTNFILPLGKKILESTLPTMLETISGFMDEIKSAIDGVDWDSLFSSLEDIVELGIDTILPVIEETLKRMEPYISDIKSELNAMATALPLVVSAIESIEKSKVYNTIKDIYTELHKLTGFDSYTFSFSKMFPDISSVLNKFSKFANLFNTIVTIIDETNWDELGESIKNGLENGFSVESIKTFFKTAFKAFIATIKDLLGIHSPSTVFASIGSDIIAGLKNGIKNAIKNIATWLKTNVISKITKAWDKLKTITVSLAGTALPSFTDLKEKYDSVKSKVAEITANAKEKIRNVVTNMKNTWETIKDKTATVITTATDKVAGGISKLKETLVGIGKTFTATVETVWSTVKDKGKEVVESVQSKLDSIKAGAEAKIQTVWDTAKDKGKDVVDTITDKLDFFSSRGKYTNTKHTAKVTTEMDDTKNKPSDSTGVFAYITDKLTEFKKGGTANVTVGLKQGTWKSVGSWAESVGGTNGNIANAKVNLEKGGYKGNPNGDNATWSSIKKFVETKSKDNMDVTSKVALAQASSWSKYGSTVKAWCLSGADVGSLTMNVALSTANQWKSVWGWAMGKNLTADQMDHAAFSYMNLYVNLKQGTNELNPRNMYSGGTITRYNGPLSSWFAGGGAISPRSKSFWKSIPKYAGGTNRAHGTMFIAGEAGPEVVGHIGARTEVLNKSQLASTMHTAIVNGMNEVMSRLGAIDIDLNASSLISGLTSIPMPVVVTGQILPATEAFFSNYAGDLKSRIENVEAKLDDIVNLLASTDTSNREEIVIQLDSRTITKIVWDNVEKRYKQTGRYSLA